MSQIDETNEGFDDSFDDDDGRESSGRSGSRREDVRPPGGTGGWMSPYKAEQGKNVRWGTFIGIGFLIAWGAKYIYDRLRVYEDTSLGFVLTTGIPILFAVGLGLLTWWATFVHPKASDFMIATEGEMKKVSWSSKKEVVGSTKVVIVVTILLSLIIFIVDIAFQMFFRLIGVLKV